MRSTASYGGAPAPGDVTGAPEAPAQEPRARGGCALVVCDQWLGSDGYGGMKALRRAGWNVHVVPEWEYIPVKWRSLPMKALGRVLRPLAVREFNADLVRHAERVRPELLLVFKGTWIAAEALDRVRAAGARCYCFYPDVSFRAHGRYIPRALPRYDWVFSTKSFGLDDMRRQLGVSRASLIRFAFDPDLHRPLELTPADEQRYGCDAVYIGTWSPKKEALLAGVLSRRPALRLRIWGAQWDRARAHVLRPAIGGHSLEGEEYARAIGASAINLAIMSEARTGSSSGDQIASRTFNIPACGGFMIHDRTPELLEIFREGEEVACYGDVEELVAAIDRYLPDEAGRRRMAERARSLVVARHSWDARIREILAHHERQLEAAGGG